MRKFPHTNSKLTARGHLLRARYKRIRAFYLKNKKMPPKTDEYFRPEDYTEAFGDKAKRRGVPAKTVANGYEVLEPIIIESAA
jgi:hypothetical protein